MATPAQIAANRRNAQRSTGPKTEEGKRRCSQNARKHGLSSRTFDPYDLLDERLVRLQRAALEQEYQPVNEHARFALDILATNMSLLRVLNRIEVQLFKEGISGPERYTRGPNIFALDTIARLEAKAEQEISEILKYRDKLFRAPKQQTQFQSVSQPTNPTLNLRNHSHSVAK